MIERTERQPLPPGFAATRASLHVVAARVLGAARYAAVGRLGLEVVPGGFGTPDFGDRRLLVIDGMLSDGERRQPFTTLADACGFAGVDPTAPTHPALEIPQDLDAALTVEPDAARALADWFWFCQTVLEILTVQLEPPEGPSPITLWPEHFDVAVVLGAAGSRANFGGSPGDLYVDEPYCYVGPFEPRTGPYWNESFGAVLRYSQILSGSDARAFFQKGTELLGEE